MNLFIIRMIIIMKIDFQLIVGLQVMYIRLEHYLLLKIHIAIIFLMDK